MEMAPHSYVFMSRCMVEATAAYIAAGGVRSSKQGVLLGNFTWMLSHSGYVAGFWAHASQHSYSAGKSAQHLPKRQTIPAAFQWAPRNDVNVAALSLITMGCVYNKQLDFDLCSWLSADRLDGFLSGHDSVEKELPSGKLFARNLPHQSRIHVSDNLERIVPNVRGARRRPQRHSQEEQVAACVRCRESIVTLSFWCTHSWCFINRFNFWFTSPSRGARRAIPAGQIPLLRPGVDSCTNSVC